MNNTFTEEQIRQAFFDTFREVGEVYFPSTLHEDVSLDHALGIVENEFEDFMMNLERVKKEDVTE